MEMAHSPLCSRSRPVLVVRPTTAPAAAAAAVTGFVQPIIRCSRFTRSRPLRCTVASSDYSKRNPRRASTPKPKGAASRTFAPRPTIESSLKKIEQSSTDEGDLGRSNGKLSSEATGPKRAVEESSEVDFSGNVSSSASLERVDDAFEAETEEEVEQNLELSSESMDDDDAIDRKLDEYRGKISALISSKPEPTSVSSTHVQDISIVGFHEQENSVVSFHEQDRSIVPVPEQSQSSGGVTGENLMEEKTITSGQDVSEEAPEEITSKSIDGEQLSREPEKALLADDESRIIKDEQYEHNMPVQDVVDPQVLMRQLEELAEKKYSAGNKCFVFPEVVKADSVVDLYLNRSMSALANESDILIKGACNGWRWNAFTEKLHKSKLRGDWWCCKLHIPKQAYRLDFVFFNGDTIYENNNYNDFILQIESDMDEHSFEDFLVEEKQRELERLAAEEAERRRQAEEERRKEEERAAMEADRAQANAEVEKTRNKLQNVLNSANKYADNLWYIEPHTYKAGDRVKLFYNRSSRPLMHNTEIWMHGGYNNWSDGLSISEKLVKSYDKDGDWWYADVTLPQKALVLDWVFADGPPGNAKNYDNNGRQDFHAVVPNNISEDLLWVEEEHTIFRRLQKERKEREDADQRKAEITAKMKAEMKEKTMREFLLSQKHIVYTEPLEVHAGTTVDVLYNPSNTVLNGKPEVWFRCSFNRWTHPSGPLPPQKMVNAENGSHLRATVRVPLDAYMMDFVFSESEEGGIYDNRNGMDYHIPVSDSIAKEPPMHIVHIAVEMAPIAKVGGLGDVVTSLSRAIQDLGHNVEVILPKYDCLNLTNVKDLHYRQSFTWGNTEIKVWFGKVEDIPVYFLEPQNGMFWVGCVYGRNDEGRFGFFCHSALEFLRQNGSSPDIIHCHDWSSAPVAWLFKGQYANNELSNGRVVFTIHNLEFGAHHIGKAMAHCDKATTVSYTYSREVSGHGAIAPHYFKFHGIRNGIDPDIWDPYSDNFIPVHYTSENVVEGKSAAKKALQQKLGLQQTDTPVVGIISRLTVQKGIHLIKHAIHRTLERNGQVVLLGSAPDHRIQGDFTNLASKLHGEFHGRVKFCLTYDEPLSHLIYAGADFILVPSMFEPCGLTQLIAMRYGSIPIVRKTGGLYDTVFDIDDDKDRAREQGLEPNGFSFEGADSNGVDYALDRAITTWYDARDFFHSLCKRVMEQDWTWNRPALDYMELYHSARKN
ncbi:starch synthase 3, chloroplastic/amyloplastic-like [Oryza brachyantha]|uniref:starch synthase n=1 Tax=Oryza brachyantha TaxID=4533 RepID=J3M1K5_ORYBR|nr:starch synthase 3, chloroplastic/amyloplastic-like [Oryza brachyantha]